MASMQNRTMDDMNRIPPPHCTKVFVQRDYSDGTTVKFSTKFLPELEGKIDKIQFENTVSAINNLYCEAESLTSRTYCESCLACLTAYLTYICMDTYYEKCIKKGSRYIEEQNNTIWVPKGLLLVDPAERGLRILEICILNESTR